MEDVDYLKKASYRHKLLKKQRRENSFYARLSNGQIIKLEALNADDVGRCVNVLSYFPEWKERIKHISDRFPCWGSIGKNWKVIEKAYNEKNHDMIELLDLYSKNKD